MVLVRIFLDGKYVLPVVVILGEVKAQLATKRKVKEATEAARDPRRAHWSKNVASVNTEIFKRGIDPFVGEEGRRGVSERRDLRDMCLKESI